MGRTNISDGSDADCAYIDHDGVKHKTAKAALYNIKGEEIWLPLSQIKDDNGEIIVIPKWLAEKNGLGSDW